MAKQPQTPEQELGPALDIMEVLTLGIVRFRWWILPFTILGLIGGAAAALIQVNKYISKAELYVEWTAENTVSPSEQVGVAAAKSASKTGWTVRKELKLLTTSVLDEMIVREVGIERLTQRINPMQFDHAGTPPLTRWQHIAQDWWINGSKKPELVTEPQSPKLNLNSPKGMAAAVAKLKNIRIKPASDNIMTIIATANSPELAQDLVAAAASSIMARHEQIFSRGQTDEFAEGLMQDYEVDEKDAESVLNTHRTDCGFYNIEEREPELRRELTTIEDSLDRYEDETIEVSTELKISKETIKTIPKTVIVRKDEILGPNPTYTAIEGKIIDRKTDKTRQAVLSTGEALTIKLKEIDNDIEFLEGLLADEDPQIVTAGERDVEEANSVYTNLITRMGTLEVRSKQLIRLQDNARKRQGRVKDELMALENCKPRHDDMKETIMAAKKNIRDIHRLQAKREIENRLADSGFKNIRILEEPSYNPNKNKPDRGMTVLIGLGIGLGVGIFFTILRQLLDSKFRYPLSVQTSLGVPVLGVIPEQRKWKKLGYKLRNKSA